MFFMSLWAAAAPRDAEWRKVADALENKQPKTALALLKPLETAAYAEKAWGEGTRALLMRVRLENGLWFNGNPLPEFRKPVKPKPKDEDPFADDEEDFPEMEGYTLDDLSRALAQLEKETATAPAEVRPILLWFQARWLLACYEDNESKIRYRSDTLGDADEDLAKWTNSRFIEEITKRYQRALEDREALRSLPASAFRGVLGDPGVLGDSLRPTVYDLVCHSMLEFLAGRDSEQDPLPLSADSPVLDGVEAFLAWRPAPVEKFSVHQRSLALYQELLAYHRDDANRDAFLHCDLERIRWAATAAKGPKRYARQAAAIRAFIAANAAHPLSADARQDDALLWMQRKNLKQAHDTALAGARAFPKHPFGKLCQGIVMGLEVQELNIDTPSSWPVSGDEISIQHKNLSRVWFRLYRYEWREDLRYDPEPDLDKGLTRLLEQKPVRAWDVALDDPRDYLEHRTTVDSAKDLEPGYYILVVSSREKFDAEKERLGWTGVHVSRLAIALDGYATESGKISGFVVDAVSGAPAANVDVGVWIKADEKKPPVKLDTKSDADGFFEVVPSPPLKSESFMAVAMDGKHRAVARGSASNYGSANSPSNESVRVFTDRRIYRPGQTIHCKAILCEADEKAGSYRTLAGRPLTLTMVGPNDQEVGKLEGVTNEYGSFSGTFTAPDSSLLGGFSIRAGELRAAYLRVEEYKRPTFEVEMKAPVAPSTLGGEVEVKGFAKSYTGAPANGAKVKWKVERNVSWAGAGAWRGWNDLDLDPVEIAAGETVTGADGGFSVRFTAAPDEVLDPAMDPVFSYWVTAEVVDQAGEDGEESCEVCAGYTEYAAEVSADDWQEAGKPVVFEVETRTHDGEPFPAEGVLRVYPVRQPERCPREIEESYDESPLATGPRSGLDGWELGDLVRELPVRTVKTDEGDTLAKVSAELPAGMYRAVFEGKDRGGCKVQAFARMQVVDPAADRFAMKLPFFFGAPEKDYQPGQTCSVLWGSGFESARACVEWYRDGVLLKREWSREGRTQQVFSLTLDESLRGGVSVRVFQHSMNRPHSDSLSIDVPWANKKLTLSWEHLTSKLEPGAKDVWTAVVKGPDGAPAAAEMVATLYDASLDVFEGHSFPGFSGLFRYAGVMYRGFRTSSESTSAYSHSGDGREYWGEIKQPFRILMPGLDGGAGLISIGVNQDGRIGELNSDDEVVYLETEIWDYYEPPELPNSVGSTSAFPATLATPATLELAAITARRKLDETAFFHPHLTSGPDGAVRISFTMPEGLGKWRFLGFAHDAAMRFGSLEGETITAKDLMVKPNPPRFLREGDVLDFTVRISNQSDKEHAGTARLALEDAATGAAMNEALGVAPDQEFTVPAKQSVTLSWRITVPDGAGFLRYMALAACGNLSDGEEAVLPVLPRRVLVTDSMELPIRDAGRRDFVMEGLRDSGKSDSLRHQFLQVNVVSQPAWHAVMALPYLMEFPHECAEQTFGRYYANALGAHLVNSDPKIRRVFDQWRGTTALGSPLLKNPDINGILVEETPWLMDAGEQSQSRRRMAMLFEENHVARQSASTLEKLVGMQLADGLWPWFSGGEGSEFITLHIAAGFGRLRGMGVGTDIAPALKAVSALDTVLTQRHAALRKAAKLDPSILDLCHLDPWIAHHLYTRSFFLNDKAVAKEDLPAREYFLKQAKQYWPTLKSRMAAAHTALALWRAGDADTARLITRSLRETAANDPLTGMSWKDSEREGWWWQAPVETQARMIEAFQEIDNDRKAVEDCRVWLIRQKQLREWGGTMATADAVFALLADRGSDGKAPTLTAPADDLLRVSLGGKTVEPGKVEAGTGIYQHRFAAAEVKPELADIAVTKESPGIAWAGVHWQYLEDLSKLDAHQSGGLKLEKSLFIRPSSGDRALKPVDGPVSVGDELVTRLVIRNERAMEYVHLKDARGSGTEPLNVLSGWRSQDGISCYEVTRNSASHFFIENLPAGTHVFETSARVQHVGVYQTGVAEIRSMYAPEFHARSAGIAIRVAAAR